MRWIKRGLIIFAGLILVLIGALAINHFVEQAQMQNFYAARPILSAMNQAATQTGNDIQAPGGSARAQAVLEARVPAGTSRNDVVRMLAAENVICSPVPGSRLNLVCGIKDSPPVVFNWHIELGFNSDDKLSQTRVLILK